MFKQFSDYFFKLLTVVVVICIIGMIVSVTVQIVTRYILNSPSEWSAELSEVFLVYVTFLGSAIAMRQGKEVRITILVERLSKVNQLRLHIVLQCIAMMYLGIIINEAIKVMAIAGGSTLTTIPFITKAWLYGVIPVGLFAMFIALFERVQRLRHELELEKAGAA